MTNLHPTPSEAPTQSLISILSRVDEAVDQDTAFVIAGIFNVYYESLRRIAGRDHLGPDDIVNIAKIINLHVKGTQLEQDFRKVRT